ncbi:stage V sporulation protein AE [Anoxybacillus tepidamans]|uniref:Stage V sporulation protein AE n=1 Tax=Anoxybacteroides tepidamans TaxID=265948 RepID=A0A7W8IPJ8_9BACL|nr:SpoVA/SpoVAEb family sporulation membrane protein [Anoxybacillus tepidamans]MBB5323497.1 stage V sporulation protein AE [Anoxybacillus tepidamans]
MEYWIAFLVGGFVCGIAQLMIDRTNFSQIHVIAGLVSAGAILGALGWYDRLVDIAGAGALLPMSGFGFLLVKGIWSYGAEHGWMGIGTGIFQFVGLELSFAIVLSFFTALICKPRG